LLTTFSVNDSIPQNLDRDQLTPLFLGHQFFPQFNTSFENAHILVQAIGSSTNVGLGGAGSSINVGIGNGCGFLITVGIGNGSSIVGSTMAEARAVRVARVRNNFIVAGDDLGTIGMGKDVEKECKCFMM